MATVTLAIAADPAHVRVVRLVAASLARLAGVPDESIDDVRLATGEACGRAVAAHQQHDCGDPVVIEVVEDVSFEITVRDAVAMAEASGRGAAELVQGTGLDIDISDLFDGDAPSLPEALGIVEGLADGMSVTTGPQGTAVVMRWDRSN